MVFRWAIHTHTRHTTKKEAPHICRMLLDFSMPFNVHRMCITRAFDARRPTATTCTAWSMKVLSFDRKWRWSRRERKKNYNMVVKFDHSIETNCVTLIKCTIFVLETICFQFVIRMNSSALSLSLSLSCAFPFFSRSIFHVGFLAVPWNIIIFGSCCCVCVFFLCAVRSLEPLFRYFATTFWTSEEETLVKNVLYTMFLSMRQEWNTKVNLMIVNIMFVPNASNAIAVSMNLFFQFASECLSLVTSPNAHIKRATTTTKRMNFARERAIERRLTGSTEQHSIEALASMTPSKR